MRSRLFLIFGIVLLLAGALVAWSVLIHPNRAVAAPEIYASPVQAGCYIAAPSDCRLHVEPFTIYLAPGEKLVYFQLIAIEAGTYIQRMIYDFRPDQSNPAPPSGDTYTPSLVAQDYAATCGKS
jgi:hypothetical protein